MQPLRVLFMKVLVIIVSHMEQRLKICLLLGTALARTIQLRHGMLQRFPIPSNPSVNQRTCIEFSSQCSTRTKMGPSTKVKLKDPLATLSQ